MKNFKVGQTWLTRSGHVAKITEIAKIAEIDFDTESEYPIEAETPAGEHHLDLDGYFYGSDSPVGDDLVKEINLNPGQVWETSRGAGTITATLPRPIIRLESGKYQDLLAHDAPSLYACKSTTFTQSTTPAATNTMKTPHVHAELIKAWADGAEIEGRGGDDQAWHTAKSPTWGPDRQYRIKPRTIKIGEHDVPEPVRTVEDLGEAYFTPSFNTPANYCAWYNRSQLVRHMSLGIVHATKEAAIAHAEALLAFTDLKA